MATHSGGAETEKRTAEGPASSSATAPENGTTPRAARVPKYYRLKRHLLEMTETMPPGTPVPPERTLAAEFDTSRTTVRQALQELVVEGRLERIQGKGTFVAKPKVSQALQLTSYTEDMRAQGLEPTSQLLDIGYVTADDTLAGLLDIQPGGRVLRIERLRLASGEPMAIETTHLSAKRFPALRRSLAKYTSLYTALAEVYDVRLAEAEETIETSLATPREAGLLGTDVGLPMLMLSRHSVDAQGKPVEWVRSVYRGDRYKFVARLKRPADD
ncbi:MULTISPECIES: GntR family transcriptional regulator [unclassified Streptomyces]|uniref:GntR family transcriptional regulator n=1 Tax=unclassified Streptomyces TaxID=2593676 RepID=UPI001D0482D0|nr:MULTISPECIES: GntR family transcriptional regulator [unclassified Streptomyces]